MPAGGLSEGEAPGRGERQGGALRVLGGDTLDALRARNGCELQRVVSPPRRHGRALDAAVQGCGLARQLAISRAGRGLALCRRRAPGARGVLDGDGAGARAGGGIGAAGDRLPAVSPRRRAAVAARDQPSARGGPAGAQAGCDAPAVQAGDRVRGEAPAGDHLPRIQAAAQGRQEARPGGGATGRRAAAAARHRCVSGFPAAQRGAHPQAAAPLRRPHPRRRQGTDCSARMRRCLPGARDATAVVPASPAPPRSSRPRPCTHTRSPRTLRSLTPRPLGRHPLL